ncbi:MAG: IPT/TIG domain-containing protein, partial [bacterium]
MKKNIYKKIVIGFVTLSLITCGVLCFSGMARAATDTLDLGISYGAQIGLGSADIRVTVANIIRVALGLLGIVAVVLMIYAGFVWMTAGGNDENITKAKKILINATIGLAIILSSYAIVSFVMNKLIEATTGFPAHCSNDVLDGDETNVDCGGSCRSCYVSPNQPYLPTDILYVTSLPASGASCVQNLHPTISFNIGVDVASVPGNIIFEKENGETAEGNWAHDGNRKNIIVFNPIGACSEGGGNDCLEASATYTIRFANFDNVKALNAKPDGTFPTLIGCRKAGTTNRANCEGVQIITGNKVDLTAPNIDFRSPSAGASLQLGDVINILTRYTDDLGAQDVLLYEGDNLIDTKTFAGCQATGDADFEWSTASLLKGAHLLTAVVHDWSAKSGQKDRVFVLRPAHCFNDLKDSDEGGVDCGGEDCGVCENGACTKNEDCASGWCQDNVCVARMFISDFTPKSGAGGTYVTIAGRYFGSTSGTVLFSAGTILKGTNLYRNPNLDDWDNNTPAEWNVDRGGNQTAFGNLYDYTDALSMVKGTSAVTNNDYVVASQYVFNVIEGNTNIGYEGSVDAKLGHYNNPEASLFLTIVSDIPPPFEGNGAYLWNFETETWVLMDESNNTVRLRFNTSFTKVFDGIGAEYKKFLYAIPNNKGLSINYIWGFKPKFSSSDIVIDNFELKPTSDVNQTVGYEARLAPCAGSWTDSQIIVEAPGGIPSGPIAVKTSGDNSWTDFTNDDYGPFLPDFTFNNVVHPGICSINPSSGFPNTSVVISGKNFGNSINNAEDKVMFGDLLSTVVSNDWNNSDITAKVPFSESKSVGVKVLNDGVESNSVRFNILGAATAANAPLITEVSPASGPRGAYITLKGQNFGNITGYVWFKKIGQTADAIMGDLAHFPAECDAVLWKDDEIVLKFDRNLGDIGSDYTVQIVNLENPAQAVVSNLDNSIKFSLVGGLPKPGICKIDPVSGPVPMAEGAVSVVGEYFGDNPEVYFWKSGASPIDITGRVKADKVGVVDVAGGKKIDVRPNIGTETGPVVLQRLEALGEENLVGVLGYWRLDGNLNNQISDLASANVAGTSWSSEGRYESGLLFSRGNDRLDLSVLNGDAISFGFGVEFWAKLNSQQMYVIDTPSALIPEGEGAIRLHRYWADGFSLQYEKNHMTYGGGKITVPAGTDLTQWNHFVINLENRNLVLYINGNGSDSGAGIPVDGLGIKKISFKLADGALDEVALYNRQLDLNADILSHYQRRITFNQAVGSAISNPLNFTVYNCKANNNQCQEGYHCCGNGECTEGVCEGETLSTGYLWRFCTKDILQPPHVVERCVNEDPAPEAWPLPTPSPSFFNSGPDASSTCLTALGIVEFSQTMVQDTVNDATVIVNSCDSVDGNSCNGPVKQTLADYELRPGGSDTQLLKLKLVGGNKWAPNTWYQVVLSADIQSNAGGERMPLEKTKPCSVPNSAYCFVFRTGTEDCKLRAVLITPYQYLTRILEQPMMYPGEPRRPVVYEGLGMSTQKCIAMNPNGYAWDWNVANRGGEYAAINGANGNTARVDANANTFGEARLRESPENAVNIEATAIPPDSPDFAGEERKTGHSPLTIDLQHPEIIGFWPNCLEACTNAEVGAKFNTTMSSREKKGDVFGVVSSDTQNSSVRLYKCATENCLDPTLLSPAPAARFDEDRQTLIIARQNLDANTIYLVKISAPSTTLGVAQLGSGVSVDDPAAFGSPYDKEFFWRFKTKSTPCLINSVEVVPNLFIASWVGERAVFKAQPRSSPDACDAKGQKLNPYSVGWDWTSTFPNVASIIKFSTVGSNRYCTTGCVRKGSDIPAGVAVIPVCGNERLEAGEDCDPPNTVAPGCSLNCLQAGLYTGSIPQIEGQPAQASVCGN